MSAQPIVPQAAAPSLQMYDPDGNVVAAPIARVRELGAKGYRASLYDPQGNEVAAPVERMADLVRKGYTTTPKTQFEQRGADFAARHPAATNFALNAAAAAGIPETAHPLSSLGENLPVAGHQLEHPIDTLEQSARSMWDQHKGDVATAANRFRQPGIGNKVVGAEEYLESGVPFLGSNVIRAQEQLERGDASGGLGTAAGTVLPFAEPEGASAIEDAAPEAIERTRDIASRVRNADLARRVFPTDEEKMAMAERRLSPVGGDKYERQQANIGTTRSLIRSGAKEAAGKGFEKFQNSIQGGIDLADKAVKDAIAQVPQARISVADLRADVAKRAYEDLPRNDADRVMRQFDRQAEFKKGDMSLGEADTLRRRWNTLWKRDPKGPVSYANKAFGDALRDQVYQKLEDEGFHGTRELRLAHGSLIDMQRSAENVAPRAATEQPRLRAGMRGSGVIGRAGGLFLGVPAGILHLENLPGFHEPLFNDIAENYVGRVARNADEFSGLRRSLAIADAAPPPIRGLLTSGQTPREPGILDTGSMKLPAAGEPVNINTGADANAIRLAEINGRLSDIGERMGKSKSPNVIRELARVRDRLRAEKERLAPADAGAAREPRATLSGDSKVGTVASGKKESQTPTYDAIADPRVKELIDREAQEVKHLPQALREEREKEIDPQGFLKGMSIKEKLAKWYTKRYPQGFQAWFEPPEQ